MIQRLTKKLGFCLAATLGICPPAEATKVCAPASEQQIRDVLTNWAKAYDRRDLDAVMKVFRADAVSQYQGWADADYDSMKGAGIKQFQAADHRSWELNKFDKLFISEWRVAAFSSWTLWKTDPAGPRSVVVKTRGVDIFERGTDCQWKVVRSMSYPDPKPPAK